MPRVLIVDDHAVVRSSLRSFFHEEASSYTVGEAATGREALELCRTEPWDVVLLDIAMPGIGGQEVLHRLRQDCPGLLVLMLSFALEEDRVRQSLAAGALGYVAKEEIPDHLLPAIQAVMAGRQYLSPGAQAVLGQGAGQPASAA
jgi:two-component system, NarL family, invasion response regulator UvrY